MSKARIIFMKTIKAILWVALAFMLLFVILAVLIQIPIVQNKIVHAATTFVSDKTHTRVEIKNVSISFPNSVVIEGLFLDDTAKDTLVYVRKAAIDISLFDILYNKINVSSLRLDGLNLNLYNSKTNALFNYNFLITAFSDTSKVDTTSTPSSWKISLKYVQLKNARIRYDDNYAGMNARLTLAKLQLKTDKMDLQNMIFEVDDLLLEQLNANVLLTKSSNPTSEKSESKLPFITANNIQLNHSILTFGDSVSHQSVYASIGQLDTRKAFVALDKNNVSFAKIYLAKSKIHYKTLKSNTDVVSTDAAVPSSTTHPWKVNIKDIEMRDNSLAYDVENTPVKQNSFDANHFDFKYFMLDVSDVVYSSALTKANILKFNAIDKNRFIITNFSTAFSMDNKSIRAKDLKASTTNSHLSADMTLQYKSLASLTKDLAKLLVNVEVKDASIKNSDILYFTPDLHKQDFFKNRKNISTFSGKITGAVENLSGRDIMLTTGRKTVLKTAFNIKGLPNAESAFYDFPALQVVSGKSDLKLMAGSFIPKTIELPEDIDMNIIFKGKMKEFVSTIDLKSSFGAGHLVASINKDESFAANTKIQSFDLGSLLKDKTMYGPVSMVATVKGKGLEPKTMRAKIKAEVSQLYLNKYNYHKLTVDGTMNGREFAGKIKLNDKNAMVDFNGLANLNPDHEQYKFNLNVQGVDLQRLNFTSSDVRLSFNTSSNIKGSNVNNLNGKMLLENLMVAHDGKKYRLDSITVNTINRSNYSTLDISSPLVDLKYSGTLSPFSLPTVLTQFANNYFPVVDKELLKSNTDDPNFNFEMQIHNHPVLSEVFLPELKEFEPGIIKGSFDNNKRELLIGGTIKKIVYGSTEIDNLVLDVHSDTAALNYKIATSGVSNSQVSLANLLFDGQLADNKLLANISSIDKLNKKLVLQSEISKVADNYKLVLNPTNFYLMNTPWSIAPDNYVEFGKKGFLIHNLFMHNATGQVNITSVNNNFNDDINIGIKNFKLEDISQIIEKESSLLKGNVDGDILLKRVNNAYGIIANTNISNLVFQNVLLGNLALKADNPTTQKFSVDMKLSGTENNMTASGYFIPNGGVNSLNIKADIQSLSMKTVKAFSMGELTDASGTMTGGFVVGGSTDVPKVTGQFVFNNAFVKPLQLNSMLELKHETVQLKPDGIYFNSFTMLDPNKHPIVIDGKIKMKQFSDFVLGLNIRSTDFLLFNTTSTKENNEFYGRMIVDSDIDLTGPLFLPVIKARLKMKKGSNFTFAVPADELTTDKGENVVEFEDSVKLNSILNRDKPVTQQIAGFKGFDLRSIIEVDKDATLKLLMDPTSADSLVVKGEAALSLTMDRSGKMSLTGAYNLNEGSYQLSLESIVKKRFEIVPGSTISWNGDPMDANMSINATYSVRTTPYDLVANQLVGASDEDKAGYKQPYPFLVVLKLRGDILQPEISFDIQLLPEDKGILGGAVNQKLLLLNDDPSALNKQVFALMVLGRFVQENPLQTETSGSTESLVRSTVSSFLSDQLNRLSSKVIPGVEMNFDIQSYEEYQTGEVQGRTQVEIGVKKQLFDERLSVEVGGKVDVEGEAAKQNSVSEMASDVSVEYKLVKDGSFRIKAFRHNLYEGAIDGQIVETGAGVMFVKDFYKWLKKRTPNP